MLPVTLIKNIPGDEDNPRMDWWRKTPFGRVQLRCPKCYNWFKLGKDFKVADDGLITPTIYHVCDNGEEDDNDGWVVNAQLEGWRL